MRNLALWAKSMPWTARFIIILSHVILVWLGIYIGRELFSLDISIFPYLVYGFAGTFIFAAFTYPQRINRHSDARYFVKQKLRDLLLATTTFGMVICLANRPDTFLSSMNSVEAAVINPVDKKKEKPTAAEILTSLKHRDKNSLTRVEKKILRQEFKKQLKNYVVATVKGDKAARASAGLIILSIVVALGLLILVAALACELSCNGADGAAVIVGVLGTAAIVLGLIFVIRSIKKKKDKPKEDNPAPES